MMLLQAAAVKTSDLLSTIVWARIRIEFCRRHNLEEGFFTEALEAAQADLARRTIKEFSSGTWSHLEELHAALFHHRSWVLAALEVTDENMQALAGIAIGIVRLEKELALVLDDIDRAEEEYRGPRWVDG